LGHTCAGAKLWGGGLTGQNQNWCLEKPVFRKHFCETAKNVKNGLNNFMRKIPKNPGFSENPTPSPPPFGPLDGEGTPPQFPHPTPLYGRGGGSRSDHKLKSKNYFLITSFCVFR